VIVTLDWGRWWVELCTVTRGKSNVATPLKRAMVVYSRLQE
jgi:hypothetical protein